MMNFEDYFVYENCFIDNAYISEITKRNPKEALEAIRKLYAHAEGNAPSSVLDYLKSCYIKILKEN